MKEIECRARIEVAFTHKLDAGHGFELEDIVTLNNSNDLKINKWGADYASLEVFAEHRYSVEQTLSELFDQIKKSSMFEMKSFTTQISIVAELKSWDI